MRKKIEITFSLDGEVKVETKGFAGPLCLAPSKFIEEALGQKGDLILTSDYYKTDTQVNQEIKRT